MIEKLAERIPRDLLDRSGSVFYAGRKAFGTPSPLYLLGINPGGSPTTQAKETVRWHTKKVLEHKSDDWSAYRDESWGGAAAGSRPMQRRVLHLIKGLGLSAGDVPASNVVFVRSRRESAIKSEYPALAELCWPFHETAIRRLHACVVVCFGQTAGNYACTRLNSVRKIDEFVESNNRRWRSCSFEADDGRVVVVVTHPSIADWTEPATDPTQLVKRALVRTA